MFRRPESFFCAAGQAVEQCASRYRRQKTRECVCLAARRSKTTGNTQGNGTQLNGFFMSAELDLSGTMHSAHIVRMQAWSTLFQKYRNKTIKTTNHIKIIKFVKSCAHRDEPMPNLPHTAPYKVTHRTILPNPPAASTRWSPNKCLSTSLP